MAVNLIAQISGQMTFIYNKILYSLDKSKFKMGDRNQLPSDLSEDESIYEPS